jgi:hypothetical protein
LIYLVQDMGKRRAFVITVTSIRLSYTQGISWVDEELMVSEEELVSCSQSAIMSITKNDVPSIHRKWWRTDGGVGGGSIPPPLRNSEVSAKLS